MANASLNFTGTNLSFNVTPVELPFMDKIWLGNTMQELVVAAIIFIASAFLMKLISVLIIRILERIDKKHPTHAKEIVVRILRAFQLPLFIMVALKIGTTYVVLPEIFTKIMNYVLFVIIVYYSIRVINAIVGHASKKVIEKREKEDEEVDSHLLGFYTKVIYAVLWILGFLFVLDHFGVDVSKILTGLGIAGIAVAFALQNVLGDIFASISIYFDKPFKPGDSIIFKGDEGEVIRTGIKSTRIKLLRGEELVISNKFLTESTLQNLSKIEKRRVKQHLGVKYGTPKKTLERIPSLIEAIIKKKYKKEAEFARCHLNAFKDYSIDFELVYYIKGQDYNLFMDIQQKINLDILDLFEKENVEFAYPTQVVHVQKSENS